MLGTFKRNTPEWTLVAALLTDLAGYFTGTVAAHDAIVAAVGVLTAYLLAAAHIDANAGAPKP